MMKREQTDNEERLGPFPDPDEIRILAYLVDLVETGKTEIGPAASSVREKLGLSEGKFRACMQDLTGRHYVEYDDPTAGNPFGRVMPSPAARDLVFRWRHRDELEGEAKRTARRKKTEAQFWEVLKIVLTALLAALFVKLFDWISNM